MSMYVECHRVVPNALFEMPETAQLALDVLRKDIEIRGVAYYRTLLAIAGKQCPKELDNYGWRGLYGAHIVKEPDEGDGHVYTIELPGLMYMPDARKE